MYKSDRQIDIPSLDICSWVFANPTDYPPNQLIYVDAEDPTLKVTFQQADALIQHLVGGLQAMGLEPGDRVCVRSLNNIYYSIMFLAVVGAGGCFVGANPSCGSKKIHHLLSLTTPKYVIVEPQFFEETLGAALACDIQDDRVFLFDMKAEEAKPNLRSWRILLNYGRKRWIQFDDEHRQSNTVAALAPTDGFRELSRIAVLSHRHFVAQNKQLYDSEDKSYPVKRLLCVPQFLDFAAPFAHIAPLRERHTTFLMNKFNTDLFLEILAKHDITEVLVTGPDISSFPATSWRKNQALHKLRLVCSQGWRMDGAKLQALTELCQWDTKFTKHWGMTELGWGTAALYREEHEVGSVGRLLPNNEARIVDEDGKDLSEEGAVGEILIRGPTLMTGYLDNSEATRTTIVNGWLLTGSLGYQEKGNWYILGRTKELTQVQGWQYSPEEMDFILTQHLSIREAGVVGIDFGERGIELPRAYIVLSDPSDRITNSAIKGFVKRPGARGEALAGGIVRTESLPHNWAGKIDKTVLRKRAAEEALQARKGIQ